MHANIIPRATDPWKKINQTDELVQIIGCAIIIVNYEVSIQYIRQGNEYSKLRITFYNKTKLDLEFPRRPRVKLLHNQDTYQK